MTQPRAGILAIGAELLSGRRADTNGPWMAQRLSEAGWDVVLLSCASDEREGLAAQIRAAVAHVDLLVTSGGLGPTGDDDTRSALAAAAGVALEEHPAAWAAIQERMRIRGRTPNAMQRRQAFAPVGAAMLDNEAGTAPGVRLTLGGAEVIALPGVPAELRGMFTQHVLPFAAAHPQAARMERRVLWVAGVPESDLANELEAMPEAVSVELAYYAHHGEMEVHATAAGLGAVVAFDEAARLRLGPNLYEPGDGGRIEHAAVGALRARGARAATAESVTGGLIAQMLTRVPGASDVLEEAWVPYATAAKQRSLGIPAELIASEGVVSAAVARAMAGAARERAGVDVAVATTGVAGPGPYETPGREPLPAGLVHVALSAADGATSHVCLRLPFPRALVQRYAAVTAIDLLRRWARGALNSDARGGGE